MTGLGRELPACDADDVVPLHLGLYARAIQDGRDVGLKADCFIVHCVLDRVHVVRIIVERRQPQFFYDARLTHVRDLPTPICSADANTAFAGGVPAQYGTVLHEGYLGPMPCGRDGRAHAGQPPSDHTEIDLVSLMSHRWSSTSLYRCSLSPCTPS